MPEKTYIRSPNNDYEPNKNIRLGHVWRNPRDPATFIRSSLPIPKGLINRNYKKDWTVDLSKGSRVKLAIRALIGNLPVGTDNSIDWDHIDDGNFKMPIMETQSFEPDPSYVSASVKPVSQEMLKSGTRLYMITGVKVAYDGEGSTTQERGFGVTSDIGVNTGTAANVGAKFEFSTSARNNEGFSGTGPFVIAYRLREVYYKKGILETKPYNKGAVLGDGMVSSQQSPDETQFVIEKARLGPSDFKPHDVEAYNFIDDEGEECELVI